MVNHPVLLLTVAAPFLLLGAPMALLIFVFLRRRWLAVTAVVVVAAVVAVVTPGLLGPPTTGPGDRPLQVATLNLHFGEADAEAVMRDVAADADVLAVQEMTPDFVARLSAAGIDERFPHRFLRPVTGSAGGGIWSRYPIVSSRVIPPYVLTTLAVTIRPPDYARPVEVVSVHPLAPWPAPIDGWRRELSLLRETLAEIAAQADEAPVIVAGDFNSTPFMHPFRQLLSDGYANAAEQAGQPFAMTFPSSFRTPPPPFMAIDHVLVRNAVATALHAVEIPRTDHRALLATVVLPM